MNDGYILIVRRKVEKLKSIESIAANIKFFTALYSTVRNN